MTEKPKQNIIEKILKLKAMAEGTSNQHEAEVFGAKMSKMMADNCIEDHHLVDKPEHIHNKVNIKYINPWRRDLILACGDASFCSVVFGRAEEVNIVGRPLNVRACLEMFQLIEKQIARIARELYPHDSYENPREARKAQVRAEGGLGTGVSQKIRNSNTKNAESLLPVVQESEASHAAAKGFMNIRPMGMRNHRQSREHVEGMRQSGRVSIREEVK